LEKQFGAKIRVPSLQKQRNYIKVASLGDKPYKSPDYSALFFQRGGLVTGATVQNMRGNVASEKHLLPANFTGKKT